MVHQLRHFATAAGVFAVAILVYDAFKISRALRASAAPEMQTKAYSASPADARSRLLVIGDSTAVGTGASASQETVAGRIGQDVNDLYIDNRAIVGARTADLCDQLADSSADFDAVLVQVGGNDILRWTPMTRLRRSIDSVLGEAVRRAPHVALIVPGLVGNAPAIPWPVNYLLNHRAREVRRLYREAAERRGIHFVDLTRGVAGEKVGDAARVDNYAQDGLHPSGAGYGRWYAALREQVPFLAWLRRPARDPADTGL
jgi:lysophospholipase L1-like esterase